MTSAAPRSASPRPCALCAVGAKLTDGARGSAQAATCSYQLYLPKYSCVEVMEKRLRYAVVNCMSIDTD